MKKSVLKIVVLCLVYILVSVGVFLILKFNGLTSVGKIRNLINGAGVWSYVAFFIFQVVVSTFICIIPFEDELLVASAVLLFGPTKGFVISAINMFATSSLQFIIGRYFCKGLVAKLIGGEAIEKYQNYLRVKGEIMLPILYAVPLFPHDSLCILAGMSKMKYWYFAPVTLFMRSIEIACVCFLGSGLIDFSAFTVMDWIVVINLLLIDIYLVLKFQKFVDNKINKKDSDKH